MPQCYVESCGNYYEKTRGSKAIIYHMLPADPVMALKWVRACGKKEQKLPYYARVCSEHFSDKCYQRDLQHELLGLPLRRKLKAGAVPDKNLHKHKSKSTGGIATKVATQLKKKLPSASNSTNKSAAGKIIIIDDDSPEPKLCSPSKPKIYNFPKEQSKKERVAKISKVPMRSSYRIAKKKSIESLSDSFTEKVNNKSQDHNGREKFSDKLKFMAKMQLKFERRTDVVHLPKYGLEESLEKITKNEGFRSLNKMQIMEDVREGCDANPPSSPGHAEQAKCSSEDNKSTHSDIVTENGIVEPQEEAVQIKQEEEEEEKRSVNEAEADEKQEENSNHSSTSSEPIKRKIDEETCNPIKKLKTDIENHFLDRDKVMSEFVELADCNNLEQIQSFSEQVLGEIKTLNEMAKEKEREWNQLLHMKKFKEELLIRLQRKRQVLIINESDLNEFQPETNGQQSLLKCNQKLNMLRELRAANLEKLKQRNSLLQNSPFKQKPMLDVQSIIADYRQRHPETVPRRGVSGGSIVAGLENNDCGYTVNGSSSNNRQEDVKSYKDILVQFAKLSQAERSELQAQLQNSGKPPPPPYPEVTVHPVTSTSSVAPTNSLLHGILTKGPVRHSSNTTNGNNAPPNGSKSSFSPTLARLLTAPEKSGGNPLTSTPTMLGASLLSAGNMSLSEIFSGAKVRNEITITPVGSHYEISTKTDPMEDESEDQPDRLIIDETSDNSSNMKSKEDNRSEDGEEVPQCQGCNRKFAQFVCAGCGNQWYCSRECQVASWDDHSEVCSG
ncbi:putative leucine-rich repeat-containing protein DDB_G0290503 isoform X2 [Euwallacea fornicatus]|uniref:putative leucine-rich repeat-containing protein DDB_G0290503 isoform X2 n=1 Tax=Euwallacea fornicatus TaxID=995702 RepID=UPI00338E47B3